jgi:hypothetical protein
MIAGRAGRARAAPPPPPAAPPAAPSRARCTSKRIVRISLRYAHTRSLRSATIYIDGRRITVLRRPHAHVRVALTGLPAGGHTVTVVEHATHGGAVALTRTYRTCESGTRQR